MDLKSNKISGRNSPKITGSPYLELNLITSRCKSQYVLETYRSSRRNSAQNTSPSIDNATFDFWDDNRANLWYMYRLSS